jgi:hypothetical protein
MVLTKILRGHDEPTKNVSCPERSRLTQPNLVSGCSCSGCQEKQFVLEDGQAHEGRDTTPRKHDFSK